MYLSLMIRFVFTQFIAVWMSAMLFALCIVGDAPAKEFTNAQIEKLIEKLGSVEFGEREKATTQLKTMERAEPQLRKSLKSADAEVRRRVEGILAALEQKRARRCLTQGVALGKEGRAVEMVDRFVYWRSWDKEGKSWDVLTRMADKLIECTARDVVPYGFPHASKFRQSPLFPAGEFRRYVERAHPKDVVGGKLELSRYGRLLIRAEDVTTVGTANPGLNEGIAAITDRARLFGVMESVVVVGGDVKLLFLDRSMLICDGDVELEQKPLPGLIIARGKVTCRNWKLTESGCIIRSENYYQFRNGKKIIIKEGTPDPVGFVKFFELADVGLTATERDQKDEPIRDGIWIKDIRKESPFASGLRAGDVVMALDGMKTPSPEALRRLLRRKLALGGPTVNFTVRREMKTLDVAIPITD